MKHKNGMVLLAGMLFLSCSGYSLDTTDRDLYELESVWQYLKTYCIWQDTLWRDTLPADAYKYGTPQELLAGVHDTLKGAGNNYTSYYYNGGGALQSQARSIDITALVSGGVYSDSLADSTGYILINKEFTKGTYADFLNAAARVREFRNIIIDLRYNGGGSLDETDSIIQSMLADSTPYIIEKFRAYDRIDRRAKTIGWDTIFTNHGRQRASLRNKRFAVLANRGSASASEILVAALKDGFSRTADTVALVGDTTYGKGMGQIVVSREHLGWSDLRITYLRIKGISERTGDYHRKGILPDVHVDCDSLENRITALIRQMNSKGNAFVQKEVDALQRKCDSLNISAALKILQPSARFGGQDFLRKRSMVPVSGVYETSVIAAPEDVQGRTAELSAGRGR